MCSASGQIGHQSRTYMENRHRQQRKHSREAASPCKFRSYYALSTYLEDYVAFQGLKTAGTSSKERHLAGFLHAISAHRPWSCRKLANVSQSKKQAASNLVVLTSISRGGNLSRPSDDGRECLRRGYLVAQARYAFSQPAAQLAVTRRSREP